MAENLKAVISDRIYIPYTTDNLKLIDENLTYKFSKYSFGEPKVEVVKNYSRFGDRAIIFPIGRKDLIPKGSEIVDNRVEKLIDYPCFIPKLRDSQMEIFEKVNDNSIINAKPGWGKTFTALAIASNLSQKTLIIVHTLNILKMWVTEVETCYNITPSVTTGGKLDISKPITIANIQTLSKHIKDIRKEFGLVIVDECHHVPSTTFQNILNRFHARYKIGLSGTLNRKDGKQILLFDSITHDSNRIYVPPKENTVTPTVLAMETGIKMPGNNTVPWALRVNALLGSSTWKDIVVRLARAQAALGRKVLVIGDRHEFVEDCANRLDNAISLTSKDKNRDEILNEMRSGKKEILFTTSGLFSEGVSENYLSCVILATPLNNASLLEQIIGRIIRKQEGKKVPVVIDLVLKGDLGRNQYRTRKSVYLKEGYTIKNVTI